MKAQELRIGNFIQCGLGSHEMVVDVLCDSINTIGGTHLYDDISPIPLTPEILIDCGFKNVQGSYYMKVGELMLALDKVWWWTNAWEADEEFGFNALAAYREITYLHQLQNLYFCLTGQELNYSPPKKVE